MKWLSLCACILLFLCLVKGEQKPAGGAEPKPGEELKPGAAQKTGVSPGEQKPGGSGEQKPGGSPGEQKPGGTGGEKKPGGSDGAQKPGGSVGEQKPGGSGEAQKPGGSGGAQKPGGSVGEQKPGGSGGAQKPGGSVGEQKPGGSGGAQKPGVIGGEQKPGVSGAEQKPVIGDKKPETKGGVKDGKTKEINTKPEVMNAAQTLSLTDSGLGNPFKLEQKIVHLNLKSSPPKIDYFRKLFPYLRGLGATGLLLEYEDMFPYSGMLYSIRNDRAYQESDIKEIVKLAAEHKLEMIPLVQTFGHLEFLLEEKEFYDLREIISGSSFVCPSASRTQQILHTMIDQVMALHDGCKWMHIGSDEVLQLGKCTRCMKRKLEGKLDNNHLFLDHVSQVAHYMKDKYKLQPIMWDDMLHPISKDILTELHIPDLVIPMIWKFGKEMQPDMNKAAWETYISTFPKFWVASAFKGEGEATKQIQDMKAHLENNKNWVDLLKTYGTKNQFTGIAITGWQSFHHFSEMSDVMAVSIPALTLDLFYLNNGGQVNDKLFEDATKALGCDKLLSLDWNFAKEQVGCNFPGSEIFSAVQKFEKLRGKMEESNGKASDDMKREVEEVEKGMKDAFSKVYFDDALEEWKISSLSPIKTMLGMIDSVDLPAGVVTGQVQGSVGAVVQGTVGQVHGTVAGQVQGTNAGQVQGTVGAVVQGTNAAQVQGAVAGQGPIDVPVKTSFRSGKSHKKGRRKHKKKGTKKPTEGAATESAAAEPTPTAAAST